VGNAAAVLAEVDEERCSQALKVFDEAMNTPGPLATWGRSRDMPVVGAFAQQALFADLLVLGQYDPTDPANSCVPADFPEAVLAASGRPALIVPYIRPAPPLADTIVIAWKETREAARAVSAALPLLQRAQRVHVLAWGEEAAPGIEGTGLDLGAYLRLHRVAATWHREGPEPDAIGEVLLSRAFDFGADLLVMGCYGHGRAREWVLGGATRTILRSATMPVLMAH
jgi:nucleotide-binding universal stress UspA family protein